MKTTRTVVHTGGIVVESPQPVDRLLFLSYIAMRPEALTGGQLRMLLAEFDALKAALH